VSEFKVGDRVMVAKTNWVPGLDEEVIVGRHGTVEEISTLGLLRVRLDNMPAYWTDWTEKALPLLEDELVKL
jgi:hypothetical protein